MASALATMGSFAGTRLAARRSASTATSAGRKQMAIRAISSDVPKSTRQKIRQLGDSDLMVSEICLGTMTFGKQNTAEEAYEQLAYAFDNGVNFIDTAEMYPVPTEADTQGSTDRYIAKWLKDQKREDVILATKVSGYSDRINWVRDSGEGPRVRKADILESIDKSLTRLGTDYVDLLQIHWPDRYVPLFGASAYDESLQRDDVIPFEEQLEAFDEVIRAGKVRYMGVSNETSYGVSEFVRLSKEMSMPKVVSIQNSYSLLVRGAYETDLAEMCSKKNHNVGLLSYSPLGGGSLTGKYAKSTPEGSRFTLFPGFMDRYNESLAKEAVAEYGKVAEKYGMTPTELALIFCADRWFMASTIIGATTMEQLKENIGAFDYELPEECVADIAKVYQRFRDPSTSPA